MSNLRTTTEHQLQVIGERLRRASAPALGTAPGGLRGTTDDFLAAASQHLAAIAEVVLPALAKLVPDSHSQSAGFLAASRRLERSLVIAKARQYGQAQNVGRAWGEIWTEVQAGFEAVATAEGAILDRLVPCLDGERDTQLGEQIEDAADRCPTRPHPHLPHRGVAGKLVRRVSSRADRVWDEFEGRVTHPIRPQHGSHG